MIYVDYVEGARRLRRPDKGPRKVPASSQTFFAHRLHGFEYTQAQFEWLRYSEGKVFRFGTQGQQLNSSRNRNVRETRGKHINRASIYEYEDRQTTQWLLKLSPVATYTMRSGDSRIIQGTSVCFVWSEPRGGRESESELVSQARLSNPCQPLTNLNFFWSF
jgi:hypothetical protein